MATAKRMQVTSTVIRHNPQFSRLVTIQLDTIQPWQIEKTTMVKLTINGVDLGRRSLKRYDDRQCWSIDLPDLLSKKAKSQTGDQVHLIIRLASVELPEELTALLMMNPEVKRRWIGSLRQSSECFARKSSQRRHRRPVYAAQKKYCCDQRRVEVTVAQNLNH